MTCAPDPGWEGGPKGGLSTACAGPGIGACPEGCGAASRGGPESGGDTGAGPIDGRGGAGRSCGPAGGMGREDDPCASGDGRCGSCTLVGSTAGPAAGSGVGSM